MRVSKLVKQPRNLTLLHLFLISQNFKTSLWGFDTISKDEFATQELLTAYMKTERLI